MAFPGLGWFSDIFEVEVELENEEYTTRYTLLIDHKTPMFNSRGIVKGRVKIKAQEGQSTWQYGVKLEIQSSASFFDSFHSENSNVVSQMIYDEGYIEKEIVVPFEIDLTQTKEGTRILENYSGDLFLLSHTLLVTVMRPWYTFDVVNYTHVALQTIESAPADENEDVINSLPLVQKLVSLSPETGFRTELSLQDYPRQVSLKYDKICYNIEDIIEGTLTFEINLNVAKEKQPNVKLIFYKIEEGDTDENEIVIREGVFKDLDLRIEEALQNEENPEAIKDENEENENQEELISPQTDEKAKQKALIKLNSSEKAETAVITQKFSFPLTEFPEMTDVDDPLSNNFLIPSFCEDFGATMLAVRFYLRLVLNDGQKEYWNTNEILLFRARFEGRHKRSVDNV